MHRGEIECIDLNENSETYLETLDATLCIEARGLAENVQECLFEASIDAPLCGAEGAALEKNGFDCIYNKAYPTVHDVPSNATDYMICVNKQNSALRYALSSAVVVFVVGVVTMLML